MPLLKWLVFYFVIGWISTTEVKAAEALPEGVRLIKAGGAEFQLRSAGLQSLLIGVESGSPHVLGQLNKGASITASEQAIAYCRMAGIEPEIGFLMFVPDGTGRRPDRQPLLFETQQTVGSARPNRQPALPSPDRV